MNSKIKAQVNIAVTATSFIYGTQGPVKSALGNKFSLHMNPHGKRQMSPPPSGDDYVTQLLKAECSLQLGELCVFSASLVKAIYPRLVWVVLDFI